MDTSLIVDSADRVRSCIASIFLGCTEIPPAIGTIKLAPHQQEAVARIRAAFDEFGGALLCDAVGAGKTFVALAVAREMKNPVIIAPAALRDMWALAMAATEVCSSFISMESLSRGAPSDVNCDCLIVDEAHHFRNRATRRHQSLVALIEDRPTLLISATPIHNSRGDLASLMSTFLGGRADHVTDAEVSRLVVRRAKKNISGSPGIPEIAPTEWWVSDDAPELAGAVMTLPPPIPCRDSGVADCLASLGLLRQWASSEGALAAALKRRIARAIALEVSLMAGEYPTAGELRSWITGDDSVQLGFPGFLPRLPDDSQIDQLLAAVRAHLAALRDLSERLGDNRPLDARKAGILRDLMRRFPDEPIIAFASYEATVVSLFRRLGDLGHVAAMTARGGRIAGGTISRAEIELQFSPDSPAAAVSERIDLLLTTDLLSEGVNLQRAKIVVHLDVPWTSARMDQRIGRIARIGSRHKEVRVFGFLPPASTERALRAIATINKKWLAASNAIGTDYDHGLDRAHVRSAITTTALHESLRTIMRRWRSTVKSELQAATVVGAARSPRSGFLACIDESGQPLLIAGGAVDIFDCHASVYQVASDAGGDEVAVEPDAVGLALKRIHTWLRVRQTRADVGLDAAAFIQSRRKVFARVNSLAASVPQHLRGSNEESIARARRFASSTHGAGRERMLSDIGPALSSLDLLADLDRRGSRAERGTTGCRVRALLLLVGPTPPPAS